MKVSFFCVLLSLFHPQQQSISVRGVVRDPGGGIVTFAKVSLLNAQQTVLRATETSDQGQFEFFGLVSGTYELVVRAAGFAERHEVVHVVSSRTAELTVVLELDTLAQQVTVTAEIGRVEEKGHTAQQVTLIDESKILERATSAVAQVANEEAGVAFQRTSPSIGGIYVRGLTGKNVVVYLDGVRYTTSAQRGGINTFMNLNDPTELRRVEILRGPASAQYGSDSLGGTVQLLSRTPALATDGNEWHGDIGSFFSAADMGFGGNIRSSFSTKRFGLLANISTRRINTLRPGGGFDSHSAVTRFLGLPSTLAGRRLADTAFTQYGGSLRVNYVLNSKTQLTLNYSRSQQDGAKRYDQLAGGDGNNVADLRNLMLDFFYVRFDRAPSAFFDNVSASFSYNRQREHRVNQGGNGDPESPIVSQYERTNAFGVQWRAGKQIGSRYSFQIGAEIYPERINSPASTFHPVSGMVIPSRPRVPDRARNIGAGVFAQHSAEVMRDVLRVVGALRYGASSYRVTGSTLWPADSLRVGDISGSTGFVLRPLSALSFHFTYSRGFRAPNMTDLGTLGLTGDGFEVAVADVARLGATIGTTADEGARSAGLPARPLRSEVSNNFDLGFRYEKPRMEVELTGFVIDIRDAIVKQALILPPGAPGRVMLGGQAIERQTSGGAVFVPLSSTPVLVRTNLDETRHYGLEFETEFRLAKSWILTGNATWIRAYDKATGVPPNIEGGTPAPRGFVNLRYRPEGRPFTIEASSVLAGPQERLSTLDLSDRRTGATRSRRTIANFFNGGAVARGLVRNGVVVSTGETLQQVQDRVLGPSVGRAPLSHRVAGYVLLNLRGTWHLSETQDVRVSAENLSDRNYRGVNWGVPGPGISVTLRYGIRF